MLNEHQMTSPEGRECLLVVLSAPSGAGKTTLGEQLLSARASFTRAVTCTTRAPRKGEKDGVDYHFLTEDLFAQHLAEGRFLEHAQVYNHFYGTLKSEVIRQIQSGRDVLLTLDVQGVRSLQGLAKDDPELRSGLVTVFLTPQTMAELEQRLIKRNQNRPEDLARRLTEARREIACWREFDYLIISTTVAEDARRMLAIVDAESMRPSRVLPPSL